MSIEAPHPSDGKDPYKAALKKEKQGIRRRRVGAVVSIGSSGISVATLTSLLTYLIDNSALPSVGLLSVGVASTVVAAKSLPYYFKAINQVEEARSELRKHTFPGVPVHRKDPPPPDTHNP